MTPPGAPSTVLLEIVWIESIINNSGLTESMWAITAPRSDSAASQRFLSIAFNRSARKRTCEADSSPEI
ncbi:unannotated protein [freshwater metagenome]|uniref:Unannotated protein n=1 Tax=freshwater metagenome TaxID=449393 RepID=A0A6J6YE34_9ZZZZ